MDERRPRRLSSEARRRQLAQVAQHLAARDGYAAFSLEEVAERADVTRNLIYHYFPRGRLDVFLAALQLSGEEVTGDWIVDPDLPLDERLQRNFLRMVAHATEPSGAWLVMRQARSSAEPEVQALHREFIDRIIRAVARNHVGTDDPPPLVRMAISAYLAAAEHALDDMRAQALPSDAVLGILRTSLLATVGSAADAAGMQRTQQV